jgi:DNA-binding IclR family transcriptional regulator
MSAVDVRQLARPLMQELARQADFNVGLGTRDQHLMVYTDAYEGDGLIGLRLFAGSRIPIMTSAMGRAYLAGLQSKERDAVLAELQPLHGDEWPRLVKAVENAAAEVKEHGFCVSAGEWRKDIHGVAAPIRMPGGADRVYSLNLGGPAYLLPEKALRSELGERIAEVARKVEKALSPRATPLPPTPWRVA